MKNLRKLFYVACTVLFFTSCEETYNDKLFWPGEITQEYGSYIKPYTLDLTYSGEKLVGKTASFKTEDSETGTLTLNDIIPGEATTPINHVKLYENGDKNSYTFSGTNITMGGATVKYSGSITPKAMKLDVNVTMSQKQVAGNYKFPGFTLGNKDIVYYGKTEGGTYEYHWASRPKQIVEAAGYFYAGEDTELTKKGSSLFTNGKLLQGALSYFLPQLLSDITLRPDGNITANYTISPLQIADKKIDEIDMDKDMGTLVNFGLKLLMGSITAADIDKAVNKAERQYEGSPINLATWSIVNKQAIIKLNLPAMLNLIINKSEKTVDPELLVGITEAISKADPIKLKSLLATLNAIIDNQMIGLISNVDDNTFKMIFDWILKGIPMGMEKQTLEGVEHTYLYLTKDATAPLISLLPQLKQPIMDMLPDDDMMKLLKMMLEGYLGTESGSFYDCWQAAETIYLGIDLIPHN